ncbi:MAG: AbrB/MazE/SpoVT family DNA-binding domain-containing protein [Methanosarcinaceae archaeon]|nr:AbrB/MazE/SpoVT family DNA-binding domain-containing protein [Methanosarcinaceae archaeon]
MKLLRKLQKTGKDSYIVTLPKSLVLVLGIEKGAFLGIELQNRKIILSPVAQARQDSAATREA